jgi:hypothetical protein
MLPRILPLLAGLMPFIAMIGAFLIGVAYESLPACNPFLDGCASISATGRKPPGSFLFRAIMLPYTVVLVFLWYYAVHWLRTLDTGLRRSTSLSIVIAGIVGALALVLYMTFLGTKLPIYEFMRRIGVYFAFLGTGLAQLFFSVASVRIATATDEFRLVGKARAMLVLSLSLFGLGVLNMILRAILDDTDQVENRIEWISALVIQIHFVVMYLAWRATGMDVSVRIREPGVR